MRRNPRIRNRVLIGLVLAAMVALSIPVVFAGGAEGDPVYAPEGVLELNLGKSDSFTWDTYTDSIQTRRNNCEVFNYSQTLATLTPFNGTIGFVKDGIGVRGAGDGGGATCGQINSANAEALSISLSGVLGDGYVMAAVDLDLEFKHGGEALIEFFLGGTLVDSVVFNPDGPADDGPDSSDGDNYRFAHDFLDETGVPTAVFDTVKITALSGELSLEGGADGTEPGTLNIASNSSQFGIYKEYDGELTCGEIATDFEAGYQGDFKLESISEDGTPVDCGSKYYDIEPDPANSDFLFAPADADTGGTAIFSGVLTADAQPITVDPLTGLQVILLEYDPTGGTTFQPMFACEQHPGGTPITSLAGVLPAGETYCFFDVIIDVYYDDNVMVADEAWYVVGEDDPNFSFK